MEDTDTVTPRAAEPVPNVDTPPALAVAEQTCRRDIVTRHNVIELWQRVESDDEEVVFPATLKARNDFRDLPYLSLSSLV